MSRFARVDSIDVLKELRVSLCLVAEDVNAGLIEAEGELQRVAGWLKNEQLAYWKAEIRKRAEDVNRAKLELMRKKLGARSAGGQPSCVDEEKALKRAQHRHEEAEQKLAHTKRWSRQLEEEIFNYQGLIRPLREAMEVEVPGALAALDGMTTALEAYASTPSPAEVTAGAKIPEGETAAWFQADDSMTRPADGAGNNSIERIVLLRGRAPSAAVRQAVLAGSPVGSRDEQARMQLAAVPEVCQLSPAVREGLASLDMPRVPAAGSDRLLMVPEAWRQAAVYLERSAPAPGDSGWFVGPAVNQPMDSLEVWATGQVLAVRPDWAEVLTLGPGHAVIVDGSRVDVLVDEQNRAIWPADNG